MTQAVRDRRIHVLVADDSEVARMLLTQVLEADPDISVIGAVGDGQAAIDFVERRTPDVIVMDIHMPHVDGFEATRRIMETRPVPIVVCTAAARPREVATTFRVMEAGALACVEKPPGPDHPEFAAAAAHLRETVKTMSEVKLVRRWSRGRIAVAAGAAREPDGPQLASGIKVIGVGASTGGPPVLQQMLAALPKDFPVPILVVQHIAHGFISGMVDWLNETTGLHVHVAGYGMVLRPGHAYFAPDDYHMGVTADGRILLTREPRHSHLRPSVAYLFQSLAEAYGRAAVGVLLTGMGRDGAAELKLLRDAGAVTIAQDQQSSVVNGMPGEAVRLGAAIHVLSAERIAEALVTIVGTRNGTGGPA